MRRNELPPFRTKIRVRPSATVYAHGENTEQQIKVIPLTREKGKYYPTENSKYEYNYENEKQALIKTGDFIREVIVEVENADSPDSVTIYLVQKKTPGLELVDWLKNYLPSQPFSNHPSLIHHLIQNLISRQIDYLFQYQINPNDDIRNFLVDTEKMEVHPIDFEEATIITHSSDIDPHLLLNQYISQCITIIREAFFLFKQNDSHLSAQMVENVVLAAWRYISILHPLFETEMLSLHQIQQEISTPHASIYLLPLQNIVKETDQYDSPEDLYDLFGDIDFFLKEGLDFNDNLLKQKKSDLAIIFLKHRLVPVQFIDSVLLPEQEEDQRIDFDLVRTALHSRADDLLDLLLQKNSELVAKAAEDLSESPRSIEDEKRAADDYAQVEMEDYSGDDDDYSGDDYSGDDYSGDDDDPMDTNDNSKINLEGLLSNSDHIYQVCPDPISKQNYMKRTFKCTQILLPFVKQTETIERCSEAFSSFLNKLAPEDRNAESINLWALKLIDLLEARKKQLADSHSEQPANPSFFAPNPQANNSSSESEQPFSTESPSLTPKT